MVENKRTLLINYIYSSIYQVITILLPFITMPYLTRTLGLDGIGKFSYSSAFIQVVIAIFYSVFLTLGSREIAYSRNNQENIISTFWKIYYVQILSVSAGLFFSISYILFSAEDYKLFLALQLTSLIAQFIDISWLFIGLEQIKKNVVRNTVIRLISVVLVFMWVKKPEDISIYIIILGITQILGSLSIWKYIPKVYYENRPKFHIDKKIIRMSFNLLLPIILSQIYLNINKLILGNVDIEQLGLYDQANKLVFAILGFITALSAVYAPRIANQYKNDTKEILTKTMTSSFQLVILISLFLIGGIVVSIEEFVPLFFGEEFVQLVYLIPILSVTIFLTSISMVFGTQFAVQIGDHKTYFRATLFAACTSILMNILMILILDLGAIGCILAYLLSELTAMLTYLLSAKKIIKIDQLFLRVLGPLVVMGISILVVTIMGGYLDVKSNAMLFLIDGSIYVLTYSTILIVWMAFKNKDVLYKKYGKK